MRKKELMEIKGLRATSKMMRLADEDTLENRKYTYSIYSNSWKGYQYGVYIRCLIENGILKAAFFLPEHMKMGSRMPAYELYIDKDKGQFLTYDRKENKWLNAKLDMIHWPQYVLFSEKKWISTKGDALIKKHLGTEHGGYRGLLEYQIKIRKEELKKRHKKETDPWDLDMAQIPELPKDWKKWVDKVGIPENYIFYKYSRKGADTGYCTYCEKDVPIRNPKHNKPGTCTCCHHKITFKSEGKAGTVVTKRCSMFLLQRCEDGIVIRAFKGYRKYWRGKLHDPELCWWEKRRVICSKEGRPMRAYYWGDYKQSEIRWVESSAYRPNYGWSYYGYYNSEENVSAGKVYGKTLPSLAGCELRYTGLPEFIKIMDKVDPEDYLDTLKSVPQLEQLAKAGLGTLAQECIQSTYAFKEVLKNTKEGSVTKMLGVNGQELKRLRKNNGGRAFMKWLQYEKSTGIVLPDPVISWYCSEGISIKDVEFIRDRMSLVQIYNYVCRQMKENRMTSKEVLTTWSDYLAMAKRRKMDTSDAIIYRVRKLRQRHDELVERCHNKNLAIQAGEILEKYPHIEEIYESVKGIYEYANKDYTVLVPIQVEDILLEGRNLHHCVCDVEHYWERIERQESYVLFLRRSSDVNKSYYTLEIEPDGTIRQKRTMFDRQEEDIEDATKFLKKWQKEISKKITDKERRLAEKSRILRLQEFAQMRENRVIINTGRLRGRLLVDVLLEDLMENKEEVTEAAVQKAA